MSLTISDAVLHATRMTAEELSVEIAVMLFQKEKLTLAQAAKMAKMSRLQFQHLLSSRKIPLHYDMAEFKEDMETLQRLGRL